MKETPFEYMLMNSYKEEMISEMNLHPEYFEEAVNLAVSDKQQYAWRSAWLLWSCIRENDKRIAPFTNMILKSLSDKNDDHQRELIKILLLFKLNEENESYLFDLCISIWEQINKKPSVRMTAFKVIVKTVKKYPALKPEMTYLTENIYTETLSSAARKSVLKIIRAI